MRENADHNKSEYGHFLRSVWDTKYFKSSYLQRVKSWNKKFIAKNLGKYALPITGSSFFYQMTSFNLVTLRSYQILIIAANATNSSFTDNSKFTCIMANVIISKPVEAYEL